MDREATANHSHFRTHSKITIIRGNAGSCEAILGHFGIQLKRPVHVKNTVWCRKKNNYLEKLPLRDIFTLLIDGDFDSQLNDARWLELVIYKAVNPKDFLKRLDWQKPFFKLIIWVSEIGINDMRFDDVQIFIYSGWLCNDSQILHYLRKSLFLLLSHYHTLSLIANLFNGFDEWNCHFILDILSNRKVEFHSVIQKQALRRRQNHNLS